MKLKFCKKCGEYTLKEKCCDEETKSPHYKFKEVKNPTGIFKRKN